MRAKTVSRINLVTYIILIQILAIYSLAQSPGVSKFERTSVASIDSRVFNDPMIGIEELNKEWIAIEKDFENDLKELKEISARLEDTVTDLQKCTEKPFCTEGRNFQAVVEFADDLQKKVNAKKFDLESKLKKASESRIRPIQTRIKLRLAEYANKIKIEVVIDLAEPENGEFSFQIVGRKTFDITREFIDFYNSASKTGAR